MEPGTIWIPLRNSLHIIADAEGKGLAKISIHMHVEDIDLLDREAAVENALLAHRYEKQREQNPSGPQVEPKVKWSRKEFAEQFVHTQCADLRERMAEQVKAVGPLPDAEDKKAVAEYAVRLDHWLNKKQNRG